MHPFQQNLPYSVWHDTHKWETDETVYDTFRRVAKDIASAEKNPKKWEEKFYELLSSFRYVPAGRILSNAGTGLKKTTYLNCFVSGFQGKDKDSIEGICDESYRQAKILASEGGYGVNFDILRPRGAYVRGIGVETSGVIEFMNVWNTFSDTLTKGSGQKKKGKKGKNKIRKGAMMATMSIWHPAIEEFITAKQTPGKFTKFNLSVLIYDDFIEAIKKNKEWNLEFPDTSYERYAEEWNGNLHEWKEKGYPVIIYKTYGNANELWDLIIKSTYNRNEPGVGFINVVNKLNNLSFIEWLNAFNPCVAKGTWVNTPKGYSRVEELKVGDWISTLHPDGMEIIKSIEINKNIEVYKVTFSDGGEQIVTAGHIYHIIDKNAKKIIKKRLDELKIGDSVQIHSPKLYVNVNRSSTMYKSGLLCGIILGDGCFTKNVVENNKTIRIATNKLETKYNDNVKELLKYFGFKINNDTVDEKYNNMSINFSGINQLKEITKLKPGYSYTKEIPEEYIKQFDERAIGILEGIFVTDGGVSLKSNHPLIRYSTTSPKLAKQIRMLLLQLDIHGRITTSWGEGGIVDGREIIQKHLKYTINISGADAGKFARIFYNCIHFEKSEKLKDLMYNYITTGNTRKAYIKSIEKHGISDAYDIYCEESDSWITEGYVQQGCGEQPLPPMGSCNLGAINLTQYIKNGKYDLKQLEKDIPVIVRFQDNVVSKTKYPLKEQKEEALNKRRCGVGYMGYGSSLFMMKLRYGSKKALKITEELCGFITNKIYQASTQLAKEKGTFPLYDEKKYLESKFIKQALNEETIKKIKKYGIRNSHLTTVAPTGNTAIFANNASGGLEPVASFHQTRTIIESDPPNDLQIPKNINWDKHTYDIDNGWEWVMEGDEWILRQEYNNVVYKIDKSRGLCKEENVYDYAVYNMDGFDETADYAKTLMEVSIDEHINTMAVFAKYADASISKTINVPNDISYENFKDVYMKAYETGVIKGVTTYRIGTTASVITKTEHTKRAKSLPCHVYKITVKGEKWIVFVGLYEGEPWEVFAGKVNLIDLKENINEGSIIRLKSGHYQFEHGGKVLVGNITDIFENEEQEAFLRMISLSLQSGVDVDKLIGQLKKSKGTVVDFNKAIIRALNRYMKKKEEGEKCPNCGESLVHLENCVICPSCGGGACG